MLSFSEFLSEALITFGGKAYPKFGNVVILTGGAASGKSFIVNNLLGIDGWVFDVDALKNLAMASTVFAAKVKAETGVDLKAMDLREPDNVRTIHSILSDFYRLDKRFQDTRFKAIATADRDRLPNLIFDTTGKSIKKFRDIHDLATKFGYDVKNIHVVWVLDDVKAAVQKNEMRDRRVPYDILLSTHEGASLTAKKMLSMGTDISQYMDGDYWIAFNKIGVDAKLTKSDLPVPETSAVGLKRKVGGAYVEEANYFKVKSSGKAPITPDELDKLIYNKIKAYVPPIDAW